MADRHGISLARTATKAQVCARLSVGLSSMALQATAQEMLRLCQENLRGFQTTEYLIVFILFKIFSNVIYFPIFVGISISS